MAMEKPKRKCAPMGANASRIVEITEDEAMVIAFVPGDQQQHHHQQQPERCHHERRIPDPPAAMGRHHHRNPLRSGLVAVLPRGIYGYRLAHLEIEAVEPAKSPLPMTETGYRSHFGSADDVDAEGGPVAFVRASLEHAAQSPEWKNA